MCAVTRMAESGFEIDREYGPADAERAAYEEKLGHPGEYPYTRHVRREGYRDRSWQPSLYSGHSSAAQANERFRFLLAEGNGRISIAFDLPTQLGLDSDDPRARHEVGRVGTAIDSLRDYEILFDGIGLDEVPITMNMNALAPVMIAMLAAVARKRGTSLDKLRGTISNDMLNEVACRGLTIWGFDDSMRLLADTAEFVVREMPSFWAFNLRGALLHEIAASPAEELGISMEMAVRYIELLKERGVAPADTASKMSHFYSSSQHFLEDAAKFRAARRMWARLLKEEYGVENERTLGLRMTAVACNGSHFVREDPELNMVRSALGVLACALGGVQTMVGTAIDEAYEIPSERTQEIALRVQQIVALESDVCATVDPLGGSYFIESMTDKIEEEAFRVREQIAEWGGLDEALKAERIQDMMRERAYQTAQEIESGERPIVGVNVHRSEGKTPEMKLWHPESDAAERQQAAVAKLREERDNDAVDAALARLEEVARDRDASVMEAMIAAVESYATVGEISKTLTKALGSAERRLVAQGV
jgi:methylmalonyl-CoA mutase N-terminal domain/subunit